MQYTQNWNLFCPKSSWICTKETNIHEIFIDWLHSGTNFKENHIFPNKVCFLYLPSMSLIFFSNRMWFLVSYLPTFSDDVTLFTVFFLKSRTLHGPGFWPSGLHRSVQSPQNHIWILAWLHPSSWCLWIQIWVRPFCVNTWL